MYILDTEIDCKSVCKTVSEASSVNDVILFIIYLCPSCSVLIQGEFQDQLAQQKAWGSKVSGYIKACQAMEQKVLEDIQTLREHWENYGYQAPRDAQRLKGW